MHRLTWNGSLESQPAARPEMTVLEAAEAMERLHSNQLVVEDGQGPIGVLTAEDILAKVLAEGKDPAQVHVAQIMSAGRYDRHGAFVVDDEPMASSIRPAQPVLGMDDDEEVLVQVLSGRCEECGVYNEELVDHEGLEMCSECSGLRTALFA